MTVRAAVTALVAALCMPALAGGGGVAWDKAEVAAAKSAATGKPVCYYFVNNEVVKSGST